MREFKPYRDDEKKPYHVMVGGGPAFVGLIIIGVTKKTYRVTIGEFAIACF